MIPYFASRIHDPLVAVGLIMLVLIFTAIIFIVHDQRKANELARIIRLGKITCPLCCGEKKIPDQAHDSHDIQFIDCNRCGGNGDIPMI